MRIVGIDPGTAIVGFGVIESIGQSRRWSMVDAGVITTPKHENDATRLDMIFTELTQLIDELKPQVMVVEKLFFNQNITTAMTVSQARGVIVLCGERAGLEIVEYTPLQIKQALVGYGRAEKTQVQEMVKVILNLKERPKPDDCADALAAALTHTTVV